MGLREAYECEFDTKHLIDVVQTNPMPTWGYVEWLEERLQEAMESPANSPASPVQHAQAKMPSYGESINVVAAETGIDELTYRERKLTLAIHDYIARYIGC